MQERILSLLTPLKSKKHSDGRFNLTEKFIEGVTEYTKNWKGSINVLLEEDTTESDNLDNVLVSSRDLPFNVEIIDYQSSGVASLLTESSIVLGGLSTAQAHLHPICQKAGVPIVYVSETTLKTRFQILSSQENNILKRCWKGIREINTELCLRELVKNSQGIQCNGIPTYDAYSSLNENPLLFFDSRTKSSGIIKAEQLSRRLDYLSSGQPLRLLFSGRWLPFKGVNHLPLVAKQLKDNGVNFTMTLCGDGPMRKVLEQQVRELSLQDRVFLKGVLDFHEELLPYVKDGVDVFVCPHLQGDPSCTYTETFACGVPIIGYNNEAFEGITRFASVGWTTQKGNIKALAQKIMDLDQNRKEIEQRSLNAKTFAEENSFEKCFKKRIDHLNSILSSPAFGKI